MLRLAVLALALCACASAPLTQVILVRHAEKADASKDPELSEAGQVRATRLSKMVGKIELGALYATQFKRTQATVAPTANAQGKTIVVLDAGDVKGLAKKIRDEHAGETVLVAAHSNTIPKVIAELGGPTIPDLAEDQFGDLFILSWTSGPAKLLVLQMPE